MYHYVYEITNVKNGKTYIGKHSTRDLDDGYMGSGKALKCAIAKHGLENFRKRILQFCESERVALDLERDLVNEAVVDDPNTYNLTVGGHSWETINRDVDANREKARRLNEAIKSDPVLREKRREANRAGQLARKANGNPSQAPDWTGRQHREETKAKIGAANSIHQRGEGNSQFGTVWIHHPQLKQSKRITSETLAIHLELGWVRGRKMKW